MSRYRTNHKRVNRTTKSRKVRRRKKNNHSLFIVLLAFTFIFSALMGTGATASRIADTETMCVTYGDTLWDIAAECNTRGDDVRDIMDDIMKLNNMKSAELHAGDIITIPIY